MGKIARITNDKKLLLVNELIEGNRFSLSADGTLHAKELIEGEQLSLNGERLEVVELIEGYDFVSEAQNSIDWSSVSERVMWSGENATKPFILPPIAALSDTYVYVELIILNQDAGGGGQQTFFYFPTNRNYFEYNSTTKYTYDPTSPDYTPISEVSSDFSDDPKMIEVDSYGEILNNTPILLKAGDYSHIAVRFATLSSESSIAFTLNFRENDENGVILFTQNWELERTGEGCYLTTAMVGYFGKADDGIELTAMRELRKHSGYKYQQMLNEYYADSPKIITGIEQSGDKDYYYNMIKSAVDSVVSLVNQEKWEQAEQTYLDLYTALKDKFIGGSDSG